LPTAEHTILFVSHDANRAGAQLMLLRWLRLLRQQTPTSFVVLLKYDGVLKREFEQIADTKVWFSTTREQSFISKVSEKMGFSLPSPQDKIKHWLSKQRIGLVVSNTLTNGELLHELSFLQCPVVSYVHELEEHLKMYTTPESLHLTHQYTQHYWVCAQYAGQYLSAHHGVAPERITWLPSLLGRLPETPDIAPEELKQTLGIAPDVQVVGGIGTADLRKGIDYFVAISRALPDVAFVWVGATQTDFERVLSDQFPPNLHFVPNTPRVHDYFGLFDVFLLTSRCEVYPMVVMEALFYQVPVVYFRDAGSTFELVEQDAGVGVSHFSETDMISTVSNLLKDSELRRSLGQVGHNKVLTRHQDEQSLAIFVRELNKYL
jgi:glycosyltransferase involved in cell wall biosynthesis